MKPSAPKPLQTSTAISDVEALYEEWVGYILILLKKYAQEEWLKAEKAAGKPKKFTPN
jgi:hypothetical protein